MKATLFIVILLLNDGSFHTTSVHVPACPPMKEVERNYEKLREANEFKDWSALCTTINFDDRNAPSSDDQPLELKV